LNDNWQEKIEVLEVKPDAVPFVHPRSHMDYSGIETRPLD